MVPEQKPALEVALLEALLDLIDRCASGGGSLHGSEAFLGESWQHLLNCLLSSDFLCASGQVQGPGFTKLLVCDTQQDCLP